MYLEIPCQEITAPTMIDICLMKMLNMLNVDATGLHVNLSEVSNARKILVLCIHFLTVLAC